MRTDPWRWYCRTCGAEAEDADESARTDAAIAHVRTEHPMVDRVVVGSSVGHELHVWPVPAHLGAPASGGILWPLDPSSSDESMSQDDAP